MCKILQTLDNADRSLLLMNERRAQFLADQIADIEKEIITIKESSWNRISENYPSLTKHGDEIAYMVNEKEGIVYVPCILRRITAGLPFEMTEDDFDEIVAEIKPYSKKSEPSKENN